MPGSTFKYGIRHADWYDIGKSFISPLGSSFNNPTSYPSTDYDYIRILHVANNLPHTLPLQNRLMIENKLYNDGLHNYDIAYHLDAFKTGQYLKKKCLKLIKSFNGKYVNICIFIMLSLKYF